MAPKHRGFTLLELLVVVLIIGITLGLVVISFEPDRADAVATETQRLAALIRLASQEAILQDREFALEVTPEGYRFLVLDEQHWQAVDERTLRARKLPEDIRLTIYFDGRPFDFLKAEKVQNPRTYILSSGEMTPVEIALQTEDGKITYHINTTISGKTDVAEP